MAKGEPPRARTFNHWTAVGCFSCETFDFETFEVRSNGLLFFFIFADGWCRLRRYEYGRWSKTVSFHPERRRGNRARLPRHRYRAIQVE
jgi:hypothetical protein